MVRETYGRGLGCVNEGVIRNYEPITMNPSKAVKSFDGVKYYVVERLDDSLYS